MSDFDETAQRAFFDTNIVVYCFDTLEPRKQTRAKDLLAHALNSQLGVVSYQVIQEFCNVATKARRLQLPQERILAYVNLVLQPMNQFGSSPALIESALKLRIHDQKFHQQAARQNIFAQCEAQVWQTPGGQRKRPWH